ncbi:DUF2393 family protein [Campylobacter troglodytis]|uniref:DUF2393 family protein n=1 Tax=Campylobacter troglodytis TaxID=654363 RepID=UPI001FE86C3F|nr:DUF2393 family protein [Campylobacter troglodytis]TQR56566.1 hypothetical protein DMC01_09135 [Campylobacter troglodytis]
MFNTLQILACSLCIVLFLLFSAVIFLLVKKPQNAIAFYAINALFMGILVYSLFLAIEDYTKQASISNLKFNRILSTESLNISGRVSNLTKFPINKCFLELTIANKLGTDKSTVFQQDKSSIKRGSNSTSYTVQIVKALPGNAYKDFAVQVPFPPNYTNTEFYHILNCI